MFDILDRSVAVPYFSDKRKELIHLKSGEFSCYFSEGDRTIKHPVCVDAIMCLKRTEDPFKYELVVSGTSNPNNLYENQQVFKVQKIMKLQIYRINMNQDVCITWIDEVNNETFEFVCKRTTCQEEAENFLSVAYECIYEDEYKSSRSFIVDEKIIALYSPHVESKVCSSVLKPKLEVYGNSIPEDIAQDATSTFIRYIPFTGTERVHGTALFLFEANLYVYRPDVRDYIYNGNVSAKVVESEPYSYHLEVYSTNIPPIYQKVCSDMNLMFVREEKAFCWNYSENGRAYSFKAVLEEKEMFEALKEFMAKSVFETSSKTSFAKYKRSNQDYIINAFTNNINSFTSMDTGKEKVEEAEDNGSLNIQKTDSAVCLTFDKCQGKHKNGDQKLFYDGTPKNYIMSACQSSGLSYLVRGNKIGVYTKDHGSCLEFSHSIDNIQTLTNSSPLYPTSALLHDQGSSYLMLDENRQDNTIYKMGLSRECIVEEWRVNDENTLMAICPSSQTACRPNNDQTIVGITSSSLFRIDPRQPRMNKLCESEYKKYSSRPEFSTVASSRSKHVAVGSKKGVIRIFDELNTVASITLPPIGEPILGLDIMPSGHYVLATCSNFLMLVHTISHDQAMTLRIRPEHVTLMNENVSFKRAYFDTLNGNNIVCTTGSFVVFWNFQSVCQGNFDSYKMQRLEAPIVASANGSKEGLIIAFEDQVCKIAK